MPILPNKEKGAREDKFLSKHRGNKMPVVIDGKTSHVEKALPEKAAIRDEKVSPKIME